MQPYRFTITGHPNITATHGTTLEFTKDTHLSKQGDCIAGINSTHDLASLKKFLQCERVYISIIAGDHKVTIIATPNPNFCDERELVIRIGEHTSERTFATRSDTNARMLPRELIKLLRDPNAQATVEVSCHER